MCNTANSPQVNASGQISKTMSKDNGNVLIVPHYQLISVWAVATLAMKELATFLPSAQSTAGRKTFLPAGYVFDSNETHFDNTVYTWGTDYVIAIVMTYFALKCLFATTLETATDKAKSHSMKNGKTSQALRWRGAVLFLCYAASVLAGGIAHQTYLTVESLNTISFRVLWTVCVGTVTAAGAPMGMIGSEILRKFTKVYKINYRLPIIPDYLWLFYGGYFTYICIIGGMSYKRPACDIFAAGTTQFLPTIYNVLVMLSIQWGITTDDACKIGVTATVQERYRMLFFTGFMGNAPLLPVYPLLVQHSHLTLGIINTLLHLNLTFAWSAQALSVYHFCTVLYKFTREDKEIIEKMKSF